MGKEEGSIYSFDSINDGPFCQNDKKPYLKCTVTGLSNLTPSASGIPRIELSSHGHYPTLKAPF
jgi:hypothetical protein